MEFRLKNGKTVVLREALVSDASSIIDYMNQVLLESKNLMREPIEWTMTIGDEEVFLRNASNSEHEYMVVVIDGEKVISTAGFHGNKLVRVKHRVSLGISILQEYQGLGLGNIIMVELINKAKEMKKTKMDLEVRVDNFKAINLYKKLGFVEEGIIKRGFFVDNKYVDLLVMGKII